ncbi:MAG: hypothetical protein QM706_15105 [Nitrospira sp.]
MPIALINLGYTDQQAQDIVRYCVGAQTLKGAPFINHDTLRQKGFDDAALGRLESSLGQAFEISFAFNKFTLGDAFCIEKLGLTEGQLNEVNFNMLKALGFTQEEIAAANDFCSGTMTVVRGTAFEGRTPRGVRLCQSVRSNRTTLHRRRCAYPHDGGGAAVHQRRDQQDH